MCGRTACTLAPDVICRACTYKEPSGDGNDGGGGGKRKHKKPRWREHPPSKENGPGAYAYYPSTNMAPTRFTPVMIIKKEQVENEDKKANVKDDELEQVDREIMPMMFGMIPFYHKGPPKSHGLSTNNCRLEGLLESKLYKRCWQQRKFCVVLCQGFYEWKTAGVGEAKNVKRQPYLIYAPQQNIMEGTTPSSYVVDKTRWENGDWNEEDGWKGPEMLKMAGLYDTWTCPSTGDVVYSYTIITMESNETLQWLHHRMPAILDTEEKVEKWLGAAKDPNMMDDSEIMELLQPVKCLQWHKVNGKVGNSRCHDEDCMKEVTEDDTKPKNTFMDKWLKKSPAVKVKHEPDDTDAASTTEGLVKRLKKE